MHSDHYITIVFYAEYIYDCNREEVTVWLPYHIINLKGFKAFVINISPALRNDSESDYSRAAIRISELKGRDPIFSILELFPIAEGEKERIILKVQQLVQVIVTT